MLGERYEKLVSPYFCTEILACYHRETMVSHYPGQLLPSKHFLLFLSSILLPILKTDLPSAP